MERERFDRLSPRQRDCLRLAYAHRTTKEIARELGIGVGTVNGYLTEAIAILGARNRRDAALLFHTHDAPLRLEGQSVGVAPPSASSPPIVPASKPSYRGGPLDPRNRDADNDYSLLARIGWIILLATALAVGYGSLAGGMHTFTEVYLAVRSAR